MKSKRNVFIIGDSYSTYKGYIPEGYFFYYFDERTEKPIVNGVEKTWWKLLEKEAGFSIRMNDSFSGSTVCNSVRPTVSVDTSFINRMDKYIAENFFAENKIDTMLIFGATNDSYMNVPIGVPQYSDWTAEDLLCALPAFCYLLHRAKSVVKDIIVIINTDLKPEITQGIIEACEKNNVKYVSLKEIDKECLHPTELGMQQIANQVLECLQTL